MKNALAIIGLGLCMSAVACPPPPHWHHGYGWHHRDSVYLGLGVATLVSNYVIANRQLEIAERQLELQHAQTQQAKNKVVYWCEGERQFYPYVRACPTGWTAMPAP